MAVLSLLIPPLPFRQIPLAVHCLPTARKQGSLAMLSEAPRSIFPRELTVEVANPTRTFPSATAQIAEGIYESRRRSILIGRIRTDSTDAVVDLAQRLCIAFDEPFVGIEVDGRYIRIYGDDTA
jgi:hypothetical protein